MPADDPNEPLPQLGNRSIREVFASAASGNADDQELMCRLTLLSADSFTPESARDMAELWARMAISQGNRTVRPVLVQILIGRALADEHNGDWKGVVENAGGALAGLDELAEEGDLEAQRVMEAYFADPAAEQWRGAIKQRAKEVRVQGSALPR